MTLLELINIVKNIAIQQPNIRTSEEGSIYEILNGNPSVKYNAFVITQGTHRQDSQFNYFNFNLFCVDRLTDDLESNRTQAQSMAIEMLSNVINTLNEVYDIEVENGLSFTTFTEKFKDECAGAYLQVTLIAEKTLYCMDGDYIDETKPIKIINQTKSITITENGNYSITYDNGYTGLKEVNIDVEVDTTDVYNKGKADGIEEGLEQGKVIGREEAIESLPSLVVNENGTYEGAFKDILVDVPQTTKISVKDSGIKLGYSNFNSIPDVFDFSGVTNMRYMFCYCENILTIPYIDTSNVTDMYYMFQGCSKLETIPSIDTSKVQTMYRMFSDTAISSLPEFDCSNLTNIERIFYSTGDKLVECGGWKNLKINWTDNYGLSRCTNLSYQSCINILNGLYDFVGHNETPNSDQGNLKVNQQLLDTVGDEISIAVSKGWNIYA